MIPEFLLPQELLNARRRWVEESIQRRLRECKPWDPKIRWEPELNLQASTYQIPELMPEVVPTESSDIDCTLDALAPEKTCWSPQRSFVYVRRILPRGQKLSTWYGSQIGSVLFDAPIPIPILFDLTYTIPRIWMSLSPAEVISLRGGTKLAKGHVVIAGLGLGHQLGEVSHRKSVTRITVVEKNQELVDWLFPIIRERLCRASVPIEMIVGDAYKVLPGLEADIALVDIFASYGNKKDEVDRIRRSSPKIKTVWGWGTAPIRDRGYTVI